MVSETENFVKSVSPFLIVKVREEGHAFKEMFTFLIANTINNICRKITASRKRGIVFIVRQSKAFHHTPRKYGHEWKY